MVAELEFVSTDRNRAAFSVGARGRPRGSLCGSLLLARRVQPLHQLQSMAGDENGLR